MNARGKHTCMKTCCHCHASIGDDAAAADADADPDPDNAHTDDANTNANAHADHVEAAIVIYRDGACPKSLRNDNMPVNTNALKSLVSRYVATPGCADSYNLFIAKAE